MLWKQVGYRVKQVLNISISQSHLVCTYPYLHVVNLEMIASKKLSRLFSPKETWIFKLINILVLKPFSMPPTIWANRAQRTTNSVRWVATEGIYLLVYHYGLS